MCFCHHHHHRHPLSRPHQTRKQHNFFPALFQPPPLTLTELLRGKRAVRGANCANGRKFNVHFNYLLACDDDDDDDAENVVSGRKINASFFSVFPDQYGMRNMRHTWRLRKFNFLTSFRSRGKRRGKMDGGGRFFFWLAHKLSITNRKLTILGARWQIDWVTDFVLTLDNP